MKAYSLLLCIIIFSSVPAQALRYEESDLSFCAQDQTLVKIFHRQWEEGHQDPYAAALVIQRVPPTSETQRKAFKERQYEDGTSIYYYFTGLEKEFAACDKYLRSYATHVHDHALQDNVDFTSLGDYPSSTVGQVVVALKKASTIVISFGAGISQGLIPTLEEFFTQIGAEKEQGQDRCTTDSIHSLVEGLMRDKVGMLKKIKGVWSNVWARNTKTSPTHETLRQLIYALKSGGKKVYVYTDNIDGFHRNAGIFLSEHQIEGGYQIDYPKTPDLKKGTVVLAMGQSFDFFANFSTILTRGSKDVQFYKMDIKGDIIPIYQGLDAECVDEDGGEGQDKNQEEKEKPPLAPLPMGWLPGSLHDTLPALYVAFIKA